jgi:hypothetical protein
MWICGEIKIVGNFDTLWEERSNIKVDLIGIWRKCEDWINLAQDGVQFYPRIKYNFIALMFTGK